MAAPYIVVQQVFDNAVATANALSDASASEIASVSAALAGLSQPGGVTIPTFAPPTFSAPVIEALEMPEYTLPATDVIEDTFSTDYVARMNEAQAAVSSALTSFFDTYFPMELSGTELTLAQDWIINVLTTGGAMDPAIENQYWQRDRDRLAREVVVKVDEVTTNWASRGFSLPPGAAVGAVLAAQRTALEEASRSSREVAIKKFEIEVQLQQKAVEMAITLRQTAMASVVEYIRSLVFNTRDASVKYGEASIQATAAANAALVAYYTSTVNANINLIQAQTQVSVASTSNQLAAAKLNLDATISTADMTLKGTLGTAELQVKENQVQGDFTLKIAEERANAAIAGAQMYATQASAALNGIHATAGVSGSSSDQTQYYG